MTFTYTVRPGDWLGVTPIVVLAVMALIVMLIDLTLPHAGERSKHSGPANFTVLPIVSVVGIILALAATINLLLITHPSSIFNGMVASDPGTLYAYLLILIASALGVLLSPAYLKRLSLVHQGEYYALFLLATIGMMLMAAATSFLIIFVGLEMFSLALYILCSFVAQRPASQESGMKYFLLSSFASAFLLYGIALIYAGTGTTFLAGNTIAQVISSHQNLPLWLTGLGLLSVGFAFKVSAVPFQTWTPDVYQGAPAPVTAFMSVGTKVAALLAFIRVFGFAFLGAQDQWMPVVEALAILTIVGGNVMALGQRDVKRMLAYSSIAHGGYLLVGIVIGGGLGASAILFYLSCYLFMNMGAFGVISLLERHDNSGYSLADLRGLWRRRPLIAGLLAFFLLSLAGFPPMAGFAAKYYLFYVALQGGHPELLIIGVLTSVLGMYYYLRFTAVLFMEEQEPVSIAAGVAASPKVPLSTRSGQATRSIGETTHTGATAVAIKPEVVVSSQPVSSSVECSVPNQTWMSRLALTIAFLGTLTVGLLLPLWLPDLVHAASLLAP